MVVNIMIGLTLLRAFFLKLSLSNCLQIVISDFYIESICIQAYFQFKGKNL